MVPVWYFTGKLTYTDAMKNARLADGFSEAQAEGRTAVIDDISDPEKFRNLKKRRFIVLDRDHLLLSEII